MNFVFTEKWGGLSVDWSAYGIFTGLGGLQRRREIDSVISIRAMHLQCQKMLALILPSSCYIYKKKSSLETRSINVNTKCIDLSTIYEI